MGRVSVVISWGSSPHTRGARATTVTTETVTWDHPRIRGEHNADGSLHFTVYQDHPRIRGEHVIPVLYEDVQEGIIPAYAGSTPIVVDPIPLVGDHPRIRGEHVPPDAPLMVYVGIIPAYAGSTIQFFASSGRVTGSSPHTRGAL